MGCQCPKDRNPIRFSIALVVSVERRDGALLFPEAAPGTDGDPGIPAPM